MYKNWILSIPFLLVALLGAAPRCAAQGAVGNPGYAFKIYYVNYGFYPIVQAYVRTWNEEREPLTNVNYANIGLMVKGLSYDPKKISPGFQYAIQSLSERSEGVRTVLVLDCSKSMAGKPFADAQTALLRYIEAKRTNDQVAVVAIRDTDDGYQLVSNFETNPTPLYQRVQDIQCDGERTRLYDSVAAAMELCATATQNTGGNADLSVLSTIVVLSDGNDEGSAISREELTGRIGQLSVPIPVYSLAYAKGDREYFRNLEAISKASFGRYWTHEASQELSATVQKVHAINKGDYVVTFRSYVPVDGEKHSFKIGLRYPSGTGAFQYEGAEFEAIDSPAKYEPTLAAQWKVVQATYPELPEGPHMEKESSVPLAPMTTPGTQAPAPPPGVTEEPEVKKAEHASASEEKPGKTEEGAALTSLSATVVLLGVGVGLLALLLVVLIWVKLGGSGKGNPPVYRPGN